MTLSYNPVISKNYSNNCFFGKFTNKINKTFHIFKNTELDRETLFLGCAEFYLSNEFLCEKTVKKIEILIFLLVISLNILSLINNLLNEIIFAKNF